MKYVLDASVALRWFIEDEQDINAVRVLERIVAEPELFAVPELFGYEVLSVLLRVHPDPLAAFCEGLVPVLQSGLLRYPITRGLIPRAIRFASFGLTGYDAMYAGLAEELGAVWLTYDEKAHTLIEKESISACLSQGMPDDWEMPV